MFNMLQGNKASYFEGRTSHRLELNDCKYTYA